MGFLLQLERLEGHLKLGISGRSLKAADPRAYSQLKRPTWPWSALLMGHVYLNYSLRVAVQTSTP